MDSSQRDRCRFEGDGNPRLIRFIDMASSAIGVLLMAPLLLVIYLSLLIVDRANPLFVQIRVGKDMRMFKIIKFRTMQVGTASVPTHLTAKQAVTRYGLVLRRYKLDELPQLWNVLLGQMSLVGPRPCLPIQIDVIRERKKLGLISCRPGITGLAQLSAIDMSQPTLLAELDAEMMRNLSIGKYLYYVLMTVRGRGNGDALNILVHK